jgi:hypothetical protein
MASFTVIYDASVLCPVPLRSVLMFLAQTDLFRARWTFCLMGDPLFLFPHKLFGQ